MNAYFLVCRRISKKSSTGSPYLPYLSEKLFEYFDKHTKEVERPKPVADLSDLQVCEIRLFENSQPITGDEQVAVEERPLKKKKKKHKSKEKELWKQVAVTPEWLSRQAKILNS
ncbi:uncharacterized protein LOC129221245 isoform X2 [Uloborus diversus]|uniref:uncharacterized protein LOC129221245 isoform X2 n=1 Tax=Uloborus diversus TaxID=327109 RepID=UPI0024095E55|nr:uncharacterized protein LOC129221245 isoform X2 [Uloborus diversus]